MNLILFFIICILLSSMSALVLRQLPKLQKATAFALMGVSGIIATYTGLKTLLTSQTIIYQINSTFPSLSWQLMLDPLSSFFLIIIGLIVLTIAFYGPGYINNQDKRRSLTTLHFFTGLFIAGMYLVLLANDAFTFMLAWELMSISSYFLVIYNHEHAPNRRAALVYLLMAQASGLFILFAFSILIKSTGHMGFTMWHSINIAPNITNIAFFLALIGFSMKAGIVPLHIWLPKAHPVAPSHISALMSGVMLKISVYGLIRFVFDSLHNIQWQWGAITLFIGTISALLGVLYALMQHDLKKLLAYHSVENIGIIFSALGLSLIFVSTHHPLLAALGLIASLYHCLNHALFKSLLFLGAGVISKYTYEHDLERMGGLSKKMPFTAICFLIGCISISALPPFNGFVSEWLFFQTALQATNLQSEIMCTLIPVTAAVIALTSALAAACFVKVYGVAFLGQARTRQIQYAQDPTLGNRCALGLLALLCLLFGIFPAITITVLNSITQQLINAQLPSPNNWMWLIPLTQKISSYNALLVSGGIITISLVTYFLLRIFYGRSKITYTLPWDCGYGGINQRMQYSATAFAMPIRRVFQSIYLVQEKIEKTKHSLLYSLQIRDRILQYLYTPLEHFSFMLARNFAKLQGGNVRIYLAYMFLTLILLLWTTI